MFFVTNRFLNEGPTPTDSNALPRSVSFARDNRVDQSVYFCRREAENNYTEIGMQAFFTELKNAKVEQILLYLHGFSNLPEPHIFPKVQELQSFFERKERDFVLVVPLIWPCDDDFGLLEDYYDDQDAADASDLAFMRMFEKFMEWREPNSTLDNPCTKRINILTHSMGLRVLRGALKRAVKRYQSKGLPLIFRNVFMAAADVINETLEPEEDGSLIPQASRNAVVYFAADDLALRASKVANVNNATAVSRRLGHTGPERMDKVAQNVYALDCADFNTEYDRPVGHGYFSSDPSGSFGLLFDHMWECMIRGRVPMNPPEARTTILNRRFW